NAIAVRFEDPELGSEVLLANQPFHGILAVGDTPAYVAAKIASRLGLRFHSVNGARAATNKLLTRERFFSAGLPVPQFRQHSAGDGPDGSINYPCVLKPLDSSASRGVIRANDASAFRGASKRIAVMLEPGSDMLVEEYIPGREFALEGVVTAGKLHVLAIFD